MTKHGHTDGFSVKGFADVIENYLGEDVLDYIIFNIQKPASSLLKRYSNEGDLVVYDKDLENKRFIGTNLLSSELYQQDPADRIKRILIRHDPDELAKTIISLI